MCLKVVCSFSFFILMVGLLEVKSVDLTQEIQVWISQSELKLKDVENYLRLISRHHFVNDQERINFVNYENKIKELSAKRNNPQSVKQRLLLERHIHAVAESYRTYSLNLIGQKSKPQQHQQEQMTAITQLQAIDSSYAQKLQALQASESQKAFEQEKLAQLTAQQASAQQSSFQGSSNCNKNNKSGRRC